LKESSRFSDPLSSCLRVAINQSAFGGITMTLPDPNLGDGPLLVYGQGDQIGRIFAYWAIVYFGQFSENYRSSPQLRGYFFHDQCYALILTKKILGYILGDFITNSSGHSVCGDKSFTNVIARR
jgi:hypothetical protein